MVPLKASMNLAATLSTVVTSAVATVQDALEDRHIGVLALLVTVFLGVFFGVVAVAHGWPRWLFGFASGLAATTLLAWILHSSTLRGRLVAVLDWVAPHQK
jgi:ABC-type multidrug transport system permease subunit